MFNSAVRRLGPQVLAAVLLFPHFSSLAQTTAPAVSPTPADSPAPAVSPNIVKVQRLLVDLGYELGKRDGYKGPLTQAAITKFQQDFSVPENRGLDVITLNRLEAEHRQMLGLRGEAVDDSDYAFFDGTGKVAVRIPIATVIPAPTDSADTSVANQQPSDEPEREFSLLAVTQEQLDELGYDPGNFEGDFSAETRAALVAFQKKSGIPQTGEPDAATNRALNKAMVQVKRDQIEAQKAAGRE